MKKLLQKIIIIFLIAILLYVIYSKYIQREKITKIFGYRIFSGTNGKYGTRNKGWFINSDSFFR